MGFIPIAGDIIMAVSIILPETYIGMPNTLLIRTEMLSQTFKPNSRNALLFEEFIVERATK